MNTQGNVNTLRRLATRWVMAGGMQIALDADCAPRPPQCSELPLTTPRDACASGYTDGTPSRPHHGQLIVPVDALPGSALHFAIAAESLLFTFPRGPRSKTISPGNGAATAHARLESFSLDGYMPVWHYAVAGLNIEKRIWLEHEARTAYVAYRLRGRDAAPATLRLRTRLQINLLDTDKSTPAATFVPALEPARRTGYGYRELVVSDRERPGQFRLSLQVRGGTVSPAHGAARHINHRSRRNRAAFAVGHLRLLAGTVQLALWADEWTGFVASMEPGVSCYLDEALRRIQRREAADRLRQRLGMSIQLSRAATAVAGQAPTA